MLCLQNTEGQVLFRHMRVLLLQHSLQSARYVYSGVVHDNGCSNSFTAEQPAAVDVPRFHMVRKVTASWKMYFVSLSSEAIKTQI